MDSVLSSYQFGNPHLVVPLVLSLSLLCERFFVTEKQFERSTPMSKVNFVSEFNSIMRHARDYSLSLRERMLWIALFYIANDRAVYNEQNQEYEWPDGFIQVSNGELNLYCCLDKRAIETLRNTLKQRGVLDFQPGVKNKRNPAYKLNYLTVGCKNVPNNVPSGASNDAPIS